MRIRTVYVCLVLLACIAEASDLKREQQYAELVKQTLKIGEIVWLQHAGQPFLSLYTQTEQTQSLGAVIILHDQGSYPDQYPLIHRLRTELPQHGWVTLALQMPVLEEAAPAADYLRLNKTAAGRIKAAVAFLQRNNIENIVLLGYGQGALSAMQYARTNPDINALVLISLYLPAEKSEQQTLVKVLNDINRPVLDVYAGQDYVETVLTARKRRLAARENKQYRQIRLFNTDHRYQHNEAFLVKRVYSWLDRQFK